MKRNTSRYRAAWETCHSLPAACYFCGLIVERWGRRSDDGSIHHVNGDHTDDDVTNLAAAHMRCHIGYHSHLRLGQSKSEHHREAMRMYALNRTVEHRERLAASQRGKPKPSLRGPKSPAHLAAIGDALRGRPLSDAHRAALKAAQSRRVRCSVCGFESSPGRVGRHRKAEGHLAATVNVTEPK